MENLKNEIEKLNLIDNIELSDIPEIDLYMDQVIQLFESKLDNYKRDENEKIMTKTMINNYVKGKLLMTVKKKKYTKEHIILISIIYQLKGGLSIADIKRVIESGNIDIEKEEISTVEDLYRDYLEMNSMNAQSFKTEVECIENCINNESHNKELLMVSTLVNKANMYRRLAEKIIDNTKEK